jgi:hypothetical protein
MPKVRSPSGRHDLARVPEPAIGFPLLATSIHNGPADIAPVAVPDPYDMQRRLRALARIDLLDRERRADRITEAQYLAGRDVERKLAGLGHIGGGGQWLDGDRVDPGTAARLAVALGYERALVANRFLDWLLRRLGVRDTRLLLLVLAEGNPLHVAAIRLGRGGRRGMQYTADRFRDALEVLAEARAARGRQ